MSQSTIQGFGLTTLDLEPPKVNPEISENITQTLDRLMVWDTINKHWVQVTGNADGAILVTSSAPSSQAPRFGRVVIGAAASRLFNVNNLRKQIVLKFQTDIDQFIGFDNTVTVGNGIQMHPGEFLSIDNYTGEIWGLNGVAGKSIQFIEV